MNITESLKNFDYFYHMSDDHNVWQNGYRNEALLVKELAAIIPQQALFLIEQHVPKELHEAWAFKVTEKRKGLT